MYYYLLFCILAGAGLVHMARRERSKPISTVRKTIPTRNDPWVWWARYLLALFVAAVLLALSGCTRKEDVGTANAYTAPDILRDPETGCQYLSHPYANSALTPRLGRDGKQVCK